MRNAKVQRAFEALRLHREGKTLREIGAALAVAHETERQLLMKARKYAVNGPPADKTERAKAAVLLRLQGVRPRDIAEKLHISVSKVHYDLRRVDYRRGVCDAVKVKALGLDDFRIAATGATRMGSSWWALKPLSESQAAPLPPPTPLVAPAPKEAATPTNAVAKWWALKPLTEDQLAECRRDASEWARRRGQKPKTPEQIAELQKRTRAAANAARVQAAARAALRKQAPRTRTIDDAAHPQA